MNVPYKYARSNINLESTDNSNLFNNLGKKYFKVLSSNKQPKITETSFLLEKESKFYQGHSYKEEFYNWFFSSLKEEDRVKASTIENKWFTAMITQMYTKFKLDEKVKFQEKNDTLNNDEMYFNSVIGSSAQANYYPPTNDLILESYFNVKNEYSSNYCKLLLFYFVVSILIDIMILCLYYFLTNLPLLYFLKTIFLCYSNLITIFLLLLTFYDYL